MRSSLRMRCYRYSDANTYTDGLTLKQAQRFKRLQGGGKVTKHVKVPYGLCSVCGHYGDDCTGARERTQGQ